jgi:hypothetical protein
MKFNRFAVIYSLTLSLVVLAAACAKKEESSPTAPAPLPSASAAPAHVADVTELKMEDLKVGTEAEAVTGKRVTVHLSRKQHREFALPLEWRLVQLGSVG